MIRSALLRRIYAVILLALVVTAGCTWLLFMLMSRSLFVNIRANEMLPRARSLSAIVNAYMEGRFDENLLLRLVDVNEKDTSIMNAYLIVADREGKISLVSDEKQTLDPQKLENQISEILSGRTVVSVLKSIGGVDIVTLGVPVYDDGGAISGALLLYVPQEDCFHQRCIHIFHPSDGHKNRPSMLLSALFLFPLLFRNYLQIPDRIFHSTAI